MSTKTNEMTSPLGSNSIQKHLWRYLGCIFLSLIFGTGYAQKEKVKATDLLKIKQAGGIRLSPDSKMVAYTLQTIEPDPEKKGDYSYRTHIWLSDFKNPSRQLTRGEGSAFNVTWKDDRTLLFTRAVKGKSQLFRLSLDGGEPEQLTDWKYGVGGYLLSPDRSSVVFAVTTPLTELLKDSLFNPSRELPTWSLEKPGFKTNAFLRPDTTIKANPDGSINEIRAYLETDVTDKKAKVFNRLNFQGEAETQPDISINHIVRFEIKEGAKPKVVTTGFQSYSAAAWHPDGKQVFAVASLDPTQHPDRQNTSRLVLVSVENGAVQEFRSAPASRLFGIKPSKDGSAVVYFSIPSEGVNLPKLLLQKGGNDPVEIPVDRAVSNISWSDDSRYVYFTAFSNGGSPLNRLSIADQKVEQLTDFDSGILDFDMGQDKIVFTKTEISNPNELYRASLSPENKGKKRPSETDIKAALASATSIGNYNSWVNEKLLSSPEKHTFTNEKGMVVEYWIMKPTGLESDKKYPLLVNMHGGPSAMWGPGEASMWFEFQYFASRGYGIVYANPRGSGGYGETFLRGNIKDWGNGPSSDVLKAADEAAKADWVDISNQFLTGGSYAGYLTSWIVGHDHRFNAAFAQRGVYDLTTFLGEGNAWRLIPGYFQFPWLDKTEKILESDSPYTYVDQIKTPLLIKHGENDLRTGVIQSEMLYKSLKIMERDVEYVRMPGATHEMSRTGNVRQRLDRILRMYEFFERYRK